MIGNKLRGILGRREITTEQRLKAQAKRREALAKRTQALAERWTGCGAAGLSAMLGDVLATGLRGGYAWRPTPSRRKRSGYTRHTGNGARRTHKRQRQVTPAPATPFRVYRHGAGRHSGPVLVCSTNNESMARVAYQGAVARFGMNMVEAVGLKTAGDKL